MAVRIALVGVGAISQIHQQALSRIPGVTIVGGIDPNSDADVPFPIFGDLAAISTLDPDVAIIATPTMTHVIVATEIRSLSERCILLVEKPMVADHSELLPLAQFLSNCYGLYHAAEGPEVIWAATVLPKLQRTHGPVVRFKSFFSDPIADSDAGQAKGNSWLDSGINALSILDRIFGPLNAVGTVRKLSQQEYLGDFELTSGCPAIIRTLWDQSTSQKWSEICFDDGATLVLDHTQRMASIDCDGVVEPMFNSRSPLQRLQEQYGSVFLSLAESDWHGNHAKDLRLHRLLLS